MQYWINHRGVQSGPLDVEGIKAMSLTSDAYVWHEGLDHWKKITRFPELQGLYELPAEQQAAAQEAVAVGQPYDDAPAATAPVQPQPASQRAPVEPCPPTNLVWAIITTLLCCLPAGVVAIVYALKVSNRYRAGDIEGAKRASETGAWWCIASIILFILTLPLVFLIEGASMT